MCEIVKFDENHTIPLECSNVKEEYYPDNEVYVSETTITDTVTINNSELNRYTRNEKIKKYEMLPLGHIKIDLSSSEVNEAQSRNIKIEDGGLCPADTQTEFCNELLFCNHCHEVYQDYCTRCRVLIHILNRTANNRIRELPKYILEARESIGHLGIFSLKVIPENVRFGPFTGLNSTGLPLRIKGGRFVISDDKSEHMNWMQYINPARNIYEQNLLAFQYDDKLYYCSTRRIQEGEELLVYFGEEYEDNLLKNVEMVFVPIAKEDIEDVFACIFCCLGFSSKKYLVEHKAASHSATKEMCSVEALTQCPFCKIYMETKEYFEHHMDYCCETNARYSVLPPPEIYKVEIERCSSEKHKAKKWKRGIYKCTQCKFRTIYSADFRHHTNEHYEVKMYKCGICHRRYKAKESLKAHLEQNHADNKGRDVEEYNKCDYFKENIKNIKERSPVSHDSETKDKCHLKSVPNMKYLNRSKYKCVNCDFKTCYRTYLERHMKITHLIESCYKCPECEFEANHKSSLVRHKNAKHLKARNYKCTECDFKTYYGSNLDKHIRAKHLKQKNYKCTECEFETNSKSYLQIHLRGKHLKENVYKCMECEFMTHRKSYLKVHVTGKHKENDYTCSECEFKTIYKANLERHVKEKHLNQYDYSCAECEYKTNYKSRLESHMKAKHLKQKNYKCTECGFMTNRKSNLKVHITGKHLQENNYKCTECAFKTIYKANLKKHVKERHLKQDYKGTECALETNYKSRLESHIKPEHLEDLDDSYKMDGF